MWFLGLLRGIPISGCSQLNVAVMLGMVRDWGQSHVPPGAADVSRCGQEGWSSQWSAAVPLSFSESLPRTPLRVPQKEGPVRTRVSGSWPEVLTLLCRQGLPSLAPSLQGLGNKVLPSQPFREDGRKGLDHYPHILCSNQCVCVRVGKHPGYADLSSPYLEGKKG